MINFEKTLKQTVDAYGLMAKKALGQNFLLDQNVTDKIIRESLEKQGLSSFEKQNVLEIGPGPGGLTRAILKNQPAHLTIIEMDERCIEIMESLKTQTGADMDIFNLDALKFDVRTIKQKPVQIISNLPYNISVPLLTGWLKNADVISAMTLMFQKEVADRICALPQTKDYGRLSVLAQLVCDIKKLLTLSPQYFTPPPQIHSTVLLFFIRQNRPDKMLLEKVEKLTQLAFSGRRKMIRQSLKSIKNLEEIALKSGVLMTSRAEEITPEQYLKMAENI